MIKFTNQKLGKTYEFDSNGPDIETLESRAEDYDEMTVPAGGLILTAGVDIQHDRVAVIIRAWGRGEENWLVYWGELAAKNSTTDVNDPVWTELDHLLFMPIKHASGIRMQVKAISIDSSDGGTSDQVYTWVRARQNRGVMAVKGASADYGNREIYSRPKKIDHKSDTKAAKYGLQVYAVGTSKAKDLLVGEKGRITLPGHGPGRMHWYQGVRSDYYEQITSEVKAPHRTMRGKRVWQKKAGVRNEALDCEVYALHAARSLKVHLLKPSAWDALEQKVMQSDLFAEPEPLPTPTPTPTTEQQPAAQQRPAQNSRVISRGVQL
jgi:phage terminase large subunit GpA-like protein